MKDPVVVFYHGIFVEIKKEDRQASSEAYRSLSMGYKKDIFAVFAYEFEHLHNRSFLVKSFAYAHGEIIYSVNCEI